MRDIAIAFALLSVALFSWVLGSEADEIALLDLAVFGCALTGILAVQLLLLSLLYKVVTRFAPGMKEWTILVVSTFLLAANAYYFAFSTLEAPTRLRVVSAACVGAVYLLLMGFRRTRTVLVLFAGFMLVMSSFQYGYARATFGRKDVTADTVSLAIQPNQNLYILGNESLHSPKAYRELFDVNDPEFVQVLEGLGFRILENAYSAERSTLRTYSKIFEFIRDFREDGIGSRGAFVNDNSTFRSFRDSGYGIQFIYVNSMFAVNVNDVDYLFPPTGFDACDESYPEYFYGLCSQEVVKEINEVLFGIHKINYKKQIRHLKDRVDYILSTGRPWLTFSHIKFPSHTKTYYRYPDPVYLADFKRRVHKALPQVAENIRQYATHVIEKDPNAVIILLGDHGTNTFRGLERDQVLSGSPPEPLEAILESIHGVTVAVYPADFCTNRISAPFSTKYLIENVIACMNGDDSPSPEERRKKHLISFFGDAQDVRELLP